MNKRDSTSLKGVAILLMVFHHLFLNRDRFLSFNGSFFPINENLLVNISISCKICVCFFSFISGYGLYCSLKDCTFKKNFITKWIKDHLLKMMSTYWLISTCSYILVFLLNYFFDFYYISLPSNNLIVNIFFILFDILGLSSIFNSFTLCGTWWYIGVAIIFICVAPIIFMALNRYSDYAVIFLVICIPFILQLNYPRGEKFLTYLPIFVSGMIFAKRNIFDLIENLQFFKNKLCSKIVVLFSLILILLALIFVMSKIDVIEENLWLIFYLVYPLILIILIKLYILKFKSISIILFFLGKHSAHIWLIHTFIREYMMRYFHIFKHFLEIYILLLFFSIITSYIIFAVKKLFNLFYKKIIHIHYLCQDEGEM